MYYIGFYQLCSAKTENHWLKTICFCETGGILLKINFDAILWNAQELRGSEILDFMVMLEWFRSFIRFRLFINQQVCVYGFCPLTSSFSFLGSCFLYFSWFIDITFSLMFLFRGGSQRFQTQTSWLITSTLIKPFKVFLEINQYLAICEYWILSFKKSDLKPNIYELSKFMKKSCLIVHRTRS